MAFFLPSLAYVIKGTLLPLLFSSPLVSSESVLEPSESGSLSHGASFWKLTEANPVVPLLPSWYRSPELDTAHHVWPHQCWAEGNNDPLSFLVFNTLCNADGDFCSKIQAGFFPRGGGNSGWNLLCIYMCISIWLNMKMFPWHMNCSGYLVSSCSKVKSKYLVFWRWFYWVYLAYLRIS